MTAAGWTHTAFPVGDASRVGEARRHAAQAAAVLDWSDVDAGRLALVVTELGSNLIKHARQGQLLVAVRPGCGDVEVIAIDEGPGIADLQACLRDGYSTGGTPGTGLGAVQRLADDFDLHSTVPDGTVCVARVRRRGTAAPAGAVQVGAVCIALHGETACGDAWAAAVDGPRAYLLVADGLGHGPEAAKASQAAVDTFAAAPLADLRSVLENAHQALQTTRGAAVCNLRLDAEAATLHVAGAGNVAVRVVSGVADRSVATQHGTLGLQVRRFEETRLELPPHALVIAHTDGIETRWQAQTIAPLLQRDPALIAAVLLRHHSRRRDDATVVVLRRVA